MNKNRLILLLLTIFLGIGSFLYVINTNNVVFAKATLSVTKVADTNDGVCDADCSLREAMTVANANPDQTTIIFDVPDFSTITLAGTALPTVETSIVIDGATAVSLTLNGDFLSQVFDIGPDGQLSINDLSIVNGFTVDYGGGIFNLEGELVVNRVNFIQNQADEGGGIFSVGGNIVISDSMFLSNTADFAGGGILMIDEGTISVTNSVFTRNIGFVGGGMLFDDSIVEIENTQFVENVGTDVGGGFFVFDSIVSANSLTFTHNFADLGSGIYNEIGYLTIDDSLFYSNTAVLDGAGIFNYGVLTVTNSIFDANIADSGGGISIGESFGIRPSAQLEDKAVLERISSSSKYSDRLLPTNAQCVQSIQSGCIGFIIAAQVKESSFINNVALNDAGAIFNFDFGSVEIIDSDFINNIADDDGGAIENSGNIAIVSSRFDDNFSGEDGGAIDNEYHLSINDSIFSDNESINDGGAIENDPDGTITITNSLFENNYAFDDGGGIVNYNVASISKSSFYDNSANESGGGIYSAGSGELLLEDSVVAYSLAHENGGGVRIYDSYATIENSTISSNSTISNGGGLAILNGNVTLNHVTLFGNDAGDGAGVMVNSGSTLSMTNSIIAGSSGAADCEVNGTLGVLSQNLIQDGSCSASISGDPLLAALDDNGGATETHDLLENSPAIDVADSFYCLPTDQRGVRRPADGNDDGDASCDIGAFELGDFLTFLPIIIQPYSDLIVDSLLVTNQSVQVTIRNIGEGPVTENFWVDVYINPDVVPTVVNQTWETQGGRGLAWGIEDVTILPNGTLTLEYNDAYYDPAESNFDGAISNGAQVYAQVDSADVDTNYGAIFELHEALGGNYNNLLGPVSP